MSLVLKHLKHTLSDASDPALLAIALMVCAGGIWWACTPRVTMKDIDRLIQKELPIGSSKAQVYEFLNSHKIRGAAYDVGPDPYIGVSTAERKRYVWARIPVPGTSLFNPDSYIHIYLYFDEQQNLSDYKLKQTDDNDSF